MSPSIGIKLDGHAVRYEDEIMAGLVGARTRVLTAGPRVAEVMRRHDPHAKHLRQRPTCSREIN